MVNFVLKNNVLFAYISGEIDHHAAKNISAKIDAQIGVTLAEMLVLDFIGVTFMDSSGIGLILGRHNLMRTIKGRVVVQGVSKSTEKILAIAGISTTKEGANV